jgi:kynurenine 3-monooxygenase
MRDRVGDAAFLLRKQVEHRLEERMPERYRSRYSMVMYSQIPYAVAREAGRIQERILADLCHGLRAVEQLDLERARRRIDDELTPFLRRHRADLDY